VVEPEKCGESVYWWDGEYEGHCERSVGHEGPHFDGMSWFNDDNEEAGEPDIAEFLRARLDETEGQLPLIVPGGGLRDALMADVGAKRRIVDWALDEEDDDGLVRAERTIESEWGSSPDLSRRLLRLLATAYAGHPSYWEGWRP